MWPEVVLVAGVLLVLLVALVLGVLEAEVGLGVPGVPVLFEGPVLLNWEKPW